MDKKNNWSNHSKSKKRLVKQMGKFKQGSWEQKPGKEQQRLERQERLKKMDQEGLNEVQEKNEFQIGSEAFNKFYWAQFS